MNVLTAEGLSLEPQTTTHAEEMFAVLSDPALYEFENAPPASCEWLRERYRKLESRRSPDGNELWLNWVIRLPGSQLIGFVQATAAADGNCAIAYMLASAFWGRSLARRSVETMIAELADEYAVHTLWASFKAANQRSRRLLERLDFHAATPAEFRQRFVEADELLMSRAARAT
jgi:RimJ/RimL family protein N-acetyltransferase